MDSTSALRGSIVLGTALALHLALYAALAWRAPRADEQFSTAEREVVLDLSTAPPLQLEPSTDDPPTSAPSPSAPRHSGESALGARHLEPGGAAMISRHDPSPNVEAPQATPTPTPNDTTPPRGERGWSMPVMPLGDVTSRQFIAGALRPSLSGQEEIGTSHAASASKTSHAAGGIVEALDAHDTAVGLTRGGPIVTALEDAATTAVAPFEGKATFDVGVDSDGHVFATLLDSNGNADGWHQVGDAARAALDPTRIRIPAGARGWHTVVKLQAGIRYPNGLDPKAMGTKVEASPTGVSLTSVGPVCSVRITVGLTLVPISGTCDPSNIGAHTLRVIHGSIVKEGRF
jgi:hypothetical protein